MLGHCAIRHPISALYSYSMADFVEAFCALWTITSHVAVFICLIYFSYICYLNNLFNCHKTSPCSSKIQEVKAVYTVIEIPVHFWLSKLHCDADSSVNGCWRWPSHCTDTTPSIIPLHPPRFPGTLKNFGSVLVIIGFLVFSCGILDKFYWVEFKYTEVLVAGGMGFWAMASQSS